jgi:hypothetical protein
LNSQAVLLNSLADLADVLTRLIETVPFVGDVAVRISPWLGLSIMVSPGLLGAFRRSIGGTLAGVVMGLFGVTPRFTHEGLGSYGWGPFGEGAGAETLRKPAKGGVSEQIVDRSEG